MDAKLNDYGRTLDRPRNTQATARKTALAAGVLYLLTFVSIPTAVLYAPVRDLNYVCLLYTSPSPRD